MDKSVKNLLYDRPELYEKLYPEVNDETPTMCRLAFERYLKKVPSLILDIACCTSRDIRRQYPSTQIYRILGSLVMLQ